MKKYLCLLALCFTAPFAFAMDVEFGGQHRMRGTYYQQDIQDVFNQRFKFTGTFRSNEMFESNFWMLTNYKWGVKGYNIFNNIGVYGYGDWKATDELMLRVGRFPYQVADGSSIGVSDYDDFPFVMDGALLSYSTESMAVDIWGSYVPERDQNVANDNPTSNTMLGLSLDVRALPEEFKMANLFVAYIMEEDVNATKEEIRLAINIGGDVSSLDYNLTGTLHGAEFAALNEYAVDAELGYTLDFDARIYVNGHYESADYNSLYYSRHARSGLLDVAEWGKGTVYGKGGITYMPSEEFEVGIMGVYFHKVGSWGQWGNNGKNPANDEDLNTKGVVEADLFVKKSYAGGFTIKIQGGLFDLTNSSPYWQAQINTTFDF